MRVIKKMVALLTTTLLSATMAVAAAAQAAKIEVKTDNNGAWYTQPVWIAIGIIALVLIIVLISLAGRRDRTTIVK